MQCCETIISKNCNAPASRLGGGTPFYLCETAQTLISSPRSCGSQWRGKFGFSRESTGHQRQEDRPVRIPGGPNLGRRNGAGSCSSSGGGIADARILRTRAGNQARCRDEKCVGSLHAAPGAGAQGRSRPSRGKRAIGMPAIVCRFCGSTSSTTSTNRNNKYCVVQVYRCLDRGRGSRFTLDSGFRGRTCWGGRRHTGDLGQGQLQNAPRHARFRA